MSYKKLESVMLETRLDMARDCINFVLGLTDPADQSEVLEIIEKIKALSLKIRNRRNG